MKLYLYLNGTLLPQNSDTLERLIDDAKEIQRANNEPLLLEIKDEYDRLLWRS